MSTNLGIASDVNNPNFMGASNPDAVLYVRFYMKSVMDNYKSEKEGRPIYFEVPYIEIMKPGDQLSVIDTPAREEHKTRFPRHWAVFQNSQGANDQVIGTRVEEWPMITRSQAEEFRGLKFFTVEQIAGASDEQIQKLGMNAPVMRQKATAYLAAAKNTALAQQQATDIEKRDQQIKDLQDQIARLALQINNKPIVENPVSPITISTKRKYTRKPKIEEPPA